MIAGLEINMLRFLCVMVLFLINNMIYYACAKKVDVLWSAPVWGMFNSWYFAMICICLNVKMPTILVMCGGAVATTLLTLFLNTWEKIKLKIGNISIEGTNKK